MGDRASSSPAPKRPAALRQLSGTLSAPLVDAGAPLRAALAGAHAPQTGGSGVLSFAARAALDPSNPEASLELFKRWRAMERWVAGTGQRLPFAFLSASCDAAPSVHAALI